MTDPTEKQPAPRSDNPKKKPAASRRDFLSLAWKSALGLSGVLGVAGVIDYFSYIPDSSNPTIFDLGPADQLPQGSVIVIEQAQAVIVPTKAGLVALSLVCPHLGCTVEINDQTYDCPCHGSRFALDGSLLKGPASEGLRELSLSVDEAGHMILDTREIVS